MTIKTAPNMAPPSIHPVFNPSFNKSITNETTADTNNTFNVGSSKHSKIESNIFNGFSGGNLLVPYVFYTPFHFCLFNVVIPFFKSVFNILHKF